MTRITQHIHDETGRLEAACLALLKDADILLTYMACEGETHQSASEHLHDAVMAVQTASSHFQRAYHALPGRD
jgi:hypothetical protein